MHVLLTYICVVLFTLAVFTKASPVLATCADSDLNTLALPSSTLPSPPTNLTLTYVALGVGTQNYTCSRTPTDAPEPAGALATLYDLTPRLRGSCDSSKSSAKSPLRHDFDLFRAHQSRPHTSDLGKIGQHFFAPGLIATFDLDRAVPPARISVNRSASVPAPPPPLSLTHATDRDEVPWLYLTDAKLGSIRTSEVLAGGVVYRVKTVGGLAPATCKGIADRINVPYQAKYWIYGPV